MDDITHVRIENTDLIREMGSKAVLSTNRQELSRYQNARKMRLQEKQYQQYLEQRINKLEQQLQQLHGTISTLLSQHIPTTTNSGLGTNRNP